MIAIYCNNFHIEKEQLYQYYYTKYNGLIFG